MILGLTTDTENDGAFGSGPRTWQTPDLDQADDVVESLEDTIAALSALGKSGCEFEDWIVAMNGAGTPNDASDHPDPRLVEGDSLKMSDVRDSLRVDYEDAFRRLGLQAVVGHRPGNVVTPRALIRSQQLVAGYQLQRSRHPAEDTQVQTLGRMPYSSRQPGAGPPPSGCSAAGKADRWQRCSGVSARHRRTSPSSCYEHRTCTDGKACRTTCGKPLRA